MVHLILQTLIWAKYFQNYSHVPRQKRPQPGVPARCSKPPQRANRADFFIIIFGKKEVRRYYSKTTLHGPRGHIRTNLIGGNMVRGLSFYSEKSFSENSENLVFFFPDYRVFADNTWYVLHGIYVRKCTTFVPTTIFKKLNKAVSIRICWPTSKKNCGFTTWKEIFCWKNLVQGLKILITHNPLLRSMVWEGAYKI